MSPFLDLDDGMEIVDSQVMEDGSVKVYEELFAEEQDYRISPRSFLRPIKLTWKRRSQATRPECWNSKNTRCWTNDEGRVHHVALDDGPNEGASASVGPRTILAGGTSQRCDQDL